MAIFSPLPTARLHTIFDPMRIAVNDSREIPFPDKGHHHHFQPRMMRALNLALQINTVGYNVYLSGAPDLGRAYILLSSLRPHARKARTPPDVLYVHNFTNPDQPVLLTLPAGQGKKFKKAMKDALENIAD